MTPPPSADSVGVSDSPETTTGTRIGLRAVTLGTITGAGAALLGYFVTYALMAASAKDILLRHGPQYSIARDVLPQHAGAIPVWKAVGWLYYNGHTAGVKFTVVGEQGGNFLNFLAYEGGLVGWLWLVPAVLLVCGGILVAAVSGVRDAANGALAGGSLMVGYGVVLLVGTSVLAVEVGVWRINPEVSFLALLGFPLFFGSVGGAGGEFIRSGTGE